MITTITLNPAIDKTFYVEGLRKGEVNKAKQIHITAGAKGINVSRVLKVLETENTAIGFAGGHTGKYLLDLLENDGVKYEYVCTKGQTRLNTKILDLRTNEFTEINEIGDKVTTDELNNLLIKLEEYLPKSPFVMLGGSIPQGLSTDIYKRIIESISRYNCKVYLDCGGKLLLEAIKASPYFVKPNLEEFNEMIGENCKTLDEATYYVNKILDMGVKILIITDGKNGSLAVHNNKIYKIFVPDVEAKSTVGAGDSFMGGFIYSELLGNDFVTSLKIASSCSVAKVTSDSSEVPDKDALLSYVDKIKIVDFV